MHRRRFFVAIMRVFSNKFTKKRTIWLGYGIFGVLVVLVSLYICFPRKTAHRYLEALASRIEPGVVLKIEKIRPALPFGLRAERADLEYKNDPGNILFKADSFVIMPSLRTLTLRKPAVRFACEAYGGTITGVVTSGQYNFHGPYSSDIEVSGVQLGLYKALQEKLKRNCSGTMDGALTYDWTQGGFLRGEGQGKFSVVDGRIFFVEPFMDLQSMDFHRINVQMVLDGQQLIVNGFDLGGRQMDASASGTIYLDSVFDRSSLDLMVSVKPSADFLTKKRALFDAVSFLTKRLEEGRFIVNVRGTLAQPRIVFAQ
jgi:type II secretion system protein N